MSSAPAKFAILFGGAGLILSLVFSLLSGNSLLHILLVVILCAAVSAGLGAGVCLVLQAKVPEFFDTFSGIGGFTASRPVQQYQMDESGAGMPAPSSDEAGLPLEHDTVAAAISSLGQTADRVTTAGKHFGDHIIVDKVKIKNEPRLMAQAIRSMLTKDD